MIKSNLDLLTYEGLTGWCVDSAAPNYRVPVKCIFNGRLSEVAMSDQSRPDLIGPTPAGDAYHGFSARTPIWSWGSGSVLELVAIDAAGRDVPIAKRTVPNYAGLQSISNGLLTAWFSLSEGGTLVGLRSAEFVHADNLIDNGQPYGRAVQIDLYETDNHDPGQPIPTEGGSEIPRPSGKGSDIVSWKASGPVFTCYSKVREWNTGETSKWSLIRITRLEGRSVVSSIMLLNEYRETKRILVSYDWYFDPNLSNQFVLDRGDSVWEADKNFLIKKSRVATIYDQWEGERGLAISYACGPVTDKWFTVDAEIARARPRCVVTGWRVFGVELAPQAHFHGHQITTVAAGVDLSRQLCADALRQAEAA